MEQLRKLGLLGRLKGCTGKNIIFNKVEILSNDFITISIKNVIKKHQKQLFLP